MTHDDVILVTGATGNVGRQVVGNLVADGRRVRALTRTPESAALPDGVEVVGGDLTAPEGLAPALVGVRAVFLVWPSLPVEYAQAAVDALAVAGRIVYLSSAGVDDDMDDQADPINQFHAGVERLVEKSGAAWTFLRCTSFAASLLEWADQVRAGVVREAFGESTRTLIHEGDIAAVAVRALTGGDEYAGRTLMLSGAAPISQIEQVRIIGEVLGREVRFEEVPLDELRAHMEAAGWAGPDIDGMFAAYATMAAVHQPVWSTVEEVTGRPARTFRDWVADHADDFS